jgi:hypothetical protein
MLQVLPVTEGKDGLQVSIAGMSAQARGLNLWNFPLT